MGENYWRRKLEQFGISYGQNVEAIKNLLMNNRGYAFEVPKEELVILLFSGGMDSTILIEVIIKSWNCKLILLYFRRNSKNQEWEEKSVDHFYSFYKERFPEHVLELLKLEIEIPTRTNKEYLDRNRQKVMGLPLRNATMWNIAFTQAVYLGRKYEKNIRTILTGSVEEDLSSPESGILSILTQNLHACCALNIWNYQLLAPFIDGTLGKVWDKIALLVYADQNDIPIQKTRSCFGAAKEPCNECLACKNRNKALDSFKKGVE